VSSALALTSKAATLRAAARRLAPRLQNLPRGQGRADWTRPVQRPRSRPNRAVQCSATAARSRL